MIRKNTDLQLTKIIEKNPGIQFRQIMRLTGLKNGVISHYIGKLEKEKTIKVVRGQRQTRFYSPTITDDEAKVIKALRRETPRNLLLALVKEDGLRFTQLVEEVRKAPATVSVYLSQMVKDELIECGLFTRKKRYYLKTRNLIDKLIEDYRPSLLEKPTSQFEDIINSL